MTLVEPLSSKSSFATSSGVFFDDPSVEQVDRSFSIPRIPRIVRDHADGRALAMQFLEQRHDRLAVLRVEVAGRFVRQQNRRRTAHRAGDATRCC